MSGPERIDSNKPTNHHRKRRLVDPFCYLCFVFVMLSGLLIAALWSPAGKGLTSWLTCICDGFLGFVTFPCGVLGQVWYLLVSISDICPLPYFVKQVFEKITF